MLRLTIHGLLQDGYEVDVVTTKGGILDDNPYSDSNSLRFHYFRYKFSQNPIVTILNFIWAQIYCFCFAFRYAFRKDTLFYINTVLPVAPAIAGWLMHKNVVYHYHENAFVKGKVYQALCWIMEFVATDIICVSAYQRNYLLKKDKTFIAPNGLSEDFRKRLNPNVEKAFERQTVMMVSSMKAYKGVREFIELARRLPQYKFVLVLNDDQETIDQTLSKQGASMANLEIYPRQKDIILFYNNKASMVLNLSNKYEFIETFGLTALEAMAAGLPSIVPTVGGISELVEHGKNGYLIDVQNLDEIEKHIDMLLSDKALYNNLSTYALKKASHYN